MMVTALAVLAGGEGQRMGGPKDLLLAEGEPVLSRLLERIAWPGPTVLVAGHAGRLPIGHARFDRVVCDQAAGQGPLRGIWTALRETDAGATVFVPIDMPRVGREHLDWIVQQLEGHPTAAGVMIRRTADGANRIEPFPCAWRVSAAPMIVRRIETGRLALHALAEDPGVAVMPAPAHWPVDVWLNVNLPGDLPADWQRPA